MARWETQTARWEEIEQLFKSAGVTMIYPIQHIYHPMIEMVPQKKADTIRKLIDLDKEVVRQLKIQAAEQDFRSVKAYIEHILILKAQADGE